MRVCILSPAAELGGAERSLLTLLQARGPAGLDASVLLPRPGPLEDELARVGVRSTVIAQPRGLLEQSRRPRPSTLLRAAALPLQLPPYVARLAGAVRSQHPDVLYSNGIKMHLLSAVLGPWLGVPVVWHVRDFIDGRLLPALADRVPVRIIANSHAVATYLRRTMRRPEKIVVVHNAVDVDEFSPDGPQADAALRVPAKFRVGLAGVLARWKGHRVLLEAAERIRAAVPGTVFFLIGGAVYDTVRERGYEDELHAEIAKRGLQDAVLITGFQRDMPPWYRVMDVVVHASTKPEPFGRTVLEAMACGRPVVAVDAGGVPEFVEQDRTGLLYAMKDSAALADAVVRVLTDEELRRGLGGNARKAVLSRHGAAEHAVEIAGVLRGLMLKSDSGHVVVG